MADCQEQISRSTVNSGDCGVANETLNVQENISEDVIDELLVEEVRNHRMLWDISARSYKDTVKKNQAWAEIASRLPQNSKYILYYFVPWFG